MLVTGAGLLLRTVVALDGVDAGLPRGSRPDHVRSPAPERDTQTPERALQFYQAAEREMASLPGVRSVGLGFSLPWMAGNWPGIFGGGRAPVAEADEPAAHYQMVNAEYFDTLGIPVLRGRAFHGA